jgi:demethylmenaquinone methyltransferase/2-methoxy-6-polyprenyl-1,4-benzoquinol methylase
VLDHFDVLARFYDRVAPHPDVNRMRALLRLPAVGLLLDAGGGTGRVSGALDALVGGVVVTDPSRQMATRARDKPGVVAVRSEVERLPFPDETFDRALVVDALHHFIDQRVAITELLRVLKPGGRLVIEEPDATRFAVKLVALIEKLALMRSRFYTPEAVRDMIAAHGIPASIERDGGFSAWIVADR